MTEKLEVHATLHGLPEQVTEANVAESVETMISDLVDVLAAFPKHTHKIDPRAWETLCVYIPWDIRMKQP